MPKLNAGFKDHLDFLVGTSSTVHGGDDRRVLNEWLSAKSVGSHPGSPEDGAADDEGEWESVLDVYRELQGVDETQYLAVNDIGVVDRIIARLLSIPHVSSTLPHIQSLLSVNRADEVISGELVDTLGFEHIELVGEILAHREEIVKHLEGLDESPQVRTPSGKSGKNSHNASVDLSHEAAQRRLQEKLEANAARSLPDASTRSAVEVLPHVYTSSTISHGNILSQYGSRYALPLGTTRVEHEECEEVTIPPPKAVPQRKSERLVPISDMDRLAAGCFPGYKTLNRIQSIVYPTAYTTNENMLVCAPTGAGKTDVAMLTILHVLQQHRSNTEHTDLRSSIKKDDFKIIYVAPMKALASEIVRKMGKRLKWLDVKVRELTGDMQMTKAEIAETQMIVTTPEKWDVVTRKPTEEGSLATKVKLLIIDEVHLLNEERGVVIETIVARTLRLVESMQTLIRIVGLSATLPNYVDVADFLRVSRYTGLFYFDSSFRPIPLEQHFLGIKGKPGSQVSKKNLDKVTYDKVVEMVQEGHQVMVFVHARKETVKAAQALKEAALMEGTIDDFSCAEQPQWEFSRREVGTSRNKELKELFNDGFGIHHAGMLRSDRNLVERLFEGRHIKVLCCTATLAWGVNLPAHAVLIKGTQLYDPSQGKFVDLSVLDVLQIFGRAGRPGFESSGVGYICTPEEKLTHFLEAVTSQNPIESQFDKKGMIDSLNAEVSLGTVSTVAEAVRWLGYTYLFVRMQKEPFKYGMPHDVRREDPNLGSKRNQLIIANARKLAECRMIAFDEVKETLTITDLGRIAAKYYIRSATIEIVNQQFRPKMSEADVFAMLSTSTEFDQIQLRENEEKELTYFMENEDIVPCQVKGGTDTNRGKVNILLQAFISRVTPEDFALVSDMLYVAQNAGRIIRALLEIAIARKWAGSGATLIALSKTIEKRMWPFANPMQQFEKDLHADVLHNLQQWADSYSVPELAGMSAEEIGKMIRMNERHGAAVLKYARQFPAVVLTHKLRPLTSNLLRVDVHVKRSFDWGPRSSGSVEPFWLWVEDHEGGEVIQTMHFVFRESTTAIEAEFMIPFVDDKKLPSITIRYISDRWLDAEDEIVVPLDDLTMPGTSPTMSLIHSLPFSTLDTLLDGEIARAFSSRLQTLNAMQTHSYWNIMSIKQNALLCGPSGSGKSALGLLLLASTMLNCKPTAWSLLVMPRRTLALQAVSELRTLLRPLKVSVDLIIDGSRDYSPPNTNTKSVRVVSSHTLLKLMSQEKWKSMLPELQLIVCDNLELLDATYELSLSLLLHATRARAPRIVGLSASLADYTDLARWLRVDPSLTCSFRPSDRDQDLSAKIQTFSIPHSAALFKAMAKPAHAALRASPAGDLSLVFVPSRSQCRPVANDLITQAAVDMDMRGYLPEHISETQLEPYLQRLQDLTLVDVLQAGIGIYHEGLSRSDRALIMEMYVAGIVSVLIVPRDALWALPVRAATVVVMGTQYVVVDGERGDRQVRDYSLQEVIHMHGRAARHMHRGQFHLFCQAEARETFTRFLDAGLPLESTLHESPVLGEWHQEMRAQGMELERRRGNGGPTSGAIAMPLGKQDMVDVLSWSFLARRIVSNPMYYDAPVGTRDVLSEVLSRCVDRLDSTSTTPDRQE